MINTKLILLEGLPGSGKSTTAQFIAFQLARNNRNAKWFFEEEFDHPTDYQWEACLNKDEFNALLFKFPEHQLYIQSIATEKESNYFIKYLEAKRDTEGMIQDIYNEMDKYNIFGSKSEIFIKHFGNRWAEFAAKAQNSDTITILDNSFLQVPITALLLLNDESTEIIEKYILTVYDSIKHLHPVIIYFDQVDYEKEVEYAVSVKGKGWRNRVSEMIGNSAFGINKRLSGLDGLMHYFKARKNLEHDLLNRLDPEILRIENSTKDWNKIRNEILDFFQLQYIEDNVLDSTALTKFTGKYTNLETQDSIHIEMINNTLTVKGHRLIHKDVNSFYLAGDCVELTFTKNESGSLHMISVSGYSSAVYYKPGTIFVKEEVQFIYG